MLCCRLLGEFLLPSSNILPHTYRGLHAIMKDIGIDYETIDACPNDHIIYYGQHASKTECLQCLISRCLLHIIFIIPMTVNDVNLNVAFKGINRLSF